MSGEIHRCEQEPWMPTIAWSDGFKGWELFLSTIKDNTSFMVATPITYCPYCGKKLKEPEKDD